MKQLFAKNGRNGSKNGTAEHPPVLLTPNGNGNGMPPEDAERAPTKTPHPEAYDQSVVLQQPTLWSRAIVWSLVGVTSFVLLWASLARIEEAVPAQGKLEPQGSVQAIQAPLGGVVKEILVEEGQRVEQGQVLIRFDPTAAIAQRQSLSKIRDSLVQENLFYRSQFAGASSPEAQPLNVPPEMLSLTANRAALVNENQLYRAQLGVAPGTNLSADQRARFRASQLEVDSRTAAARLEVSQFQQQLIQVDEQLQTARQTLEIEETILSDIRPLVEEGGLARIQFLRQQQEAMKGQAEVDRLVQEKRRLEFAIAQAQEKLQNTLALTSTDLLDKIAANDEQIANIDSQINKAIVDNEKRIAEIDSQLSETNLTLEYQELRAPIDGVVFDLKAKGIGFVANTSEPILKVVPNNALVAEVYVTNQDIGFVREGMPVDVRVDSFPFSEFGDIKGELVQIGSDALPPDQVYPFYRFPVKVEFDQQSLMVNGTEIPLQSGMSVTANIITRDRTVLSIFTDLFSKRIESLKTVR